MMSTCKGANELVSMVTATNSKDPPKIKKLISIGYQKLNPATFIYIPYAMPRNQKPAKMGKV